jgi:hypothetical protein
MNEVDSSKSLLYNLNKLIDVVAENAYTAGQESADYYT